MKIEKPYLKSRVVDSKAFAILLSPLSFTTNTAESGPRSGAISADTSTISSSKDARTFNITIQLGRLNELRLPCFRELSSELALDVPAKETSKQSFFKTTGALVSAAIKSLDPRAWLERLSHDFGLLKNSVNVGKYSESKNEITKLAKSINGRVFASLLFSDACAYLAVPVSAAVQAATGNALLALPVGIATAYGIAVASFQAGFAFTAKDMYKENYPGILQRVKEFEKDLFPIHKKAFLAAAGCYAISLPVTSIVAYGITKLPEVFARGLPIAAIEATLSIVLFEALFLKAMSSFNQRHSENLAKK